MHPASCEKCVSEEETRGVKQREREEERKKFHLQHVSRKRDVQSRGIVLVLNLSRARARCLIKLNEFTAGHTLLRGCYTFVTTWTMPAGYARSHSRLAFVVFQRGEFASWFAGGATE